MFTSAGKLYRGPRLRTLVRSNGPTFVMGHSMDGRTARRHNTVRDAGYDVLTFG